MKTAHQTIIIILIILCTYTVPFLTFTSCFKFSIPCKMVKGKNKHALLSFCCQPLENAFVLESHLQDYKMFGECCTAQELWNFQHY